MSPNAERLREVLFAARGAFWDANQPMKKTETVFVVRELMREVLALELEPLELTVRVMPQEVSGQLFLGEKDDLHLGLVNDEVFLDPALDVVRESGLALDPVIINDLSSRKGGRGFARGERELNLEQQKVRLRYKAFPKRRRWDTDAWGALAAAQAPLIERLKSELAV